MDAKLINFIQQNSPDGGFLQSDEWRKFQEAVGRKTYGITGEKFNASVVEHSLPLVGKYLYAPRGPVMSISNFQFPTLPTGRQVSNKISNLNNQFSKQIQSLIDLAEKENAEWIRIEPASEEILNVIKENSNFKITKAPHDMQPREILVMNITKSEEEILAEMKSKTRYNIHLAEKKGVKTWNMEHGTRNKKCIEEFLRLVKITAERNKITSHPENYYRKMLEAIPGDILKLYVAEYDNKIIAANLVVFYGNTATYLHGASDDDYRNAMAPYLLQWRQIQDACIAGCGKYDLGGVKINSKGGKSWEGVTRFKIGFSPKTNPVEFPGSWDIIISPSKYFTYRTIQKMKNLF
jgi:peptidoglycan pentaglycine glycine transferase (the first glycine)